MIGEIISVGTELLLGNIINTNSQYISQKLSELGIDVFYHTVVGDNAVRIAEVLKTSLSRSDIIIITGGLGPTDDDLTKEAVCTFLGIDLILNQRELDRIRHRFNTINIPMPECNTKQAYIPKGSIILQNNNGTASGIIIEQNNKTVILLPGPPGELIPMFEQSVCPYLTLRYDNIIVSKVVKVVGIGESSIQEILNEVFKTQTNPTIAPYAKDGEVHLRITAKASTRDLANNSIEQMLNKIINVLGDNIYGFDEDTLEGCVVDLLLRNKKTISIAESCTGGLIGHRITNIAGSSLSFMNGIVCYSNESKINLLGVKENTIKLHGAVSCQTVYEMAQGVKHIAKTDIGLAVTGIAGPGGGSKEKPVGLFYVGIAYHDKIETYKYLYPEERKKIKWFVSTVALDIVRRKLLK